MFCVIFVYIEIVRFAAAFRRKQTTLRIYFLLIKFICYLPKYARNTSHSENIIESRTKIMRVFLSVMHQVQQFNVQGLAARESSSIFS
jgi:hypothetical protein